MTLHNNYIKSKEEKNVVTRYSLLREMIKVSGRPHTPNLDILEMLELKLGVIRMPVKQLLAAQKLISQTPAVMMFPTLHFVGYGNKIFTSLVLYFIPFHFPSFLWEPSETPKGT